MTLYQTPEKYHYRLHLVRPRFKRDIENVLIFMATEISKIPDLPSSEFNEILNKIIYQYPGNATKKPATINNWRTEISTLFAFFNKQGNGRTVARRRAIELVEKQDLVELFKKFMFLFQYPGAHVKDYEVATMIEAGIRFKPASYILKVLEAGEAETKGRAFVTKEEVCHCILNDLRCTRDNEPPAAAWRRISENRETKLGYDKTGDVVRYAGDILEYMEIANLLVTHDRKRFYINTLETETVLKFISSKLWFSGYDEMIANKSATLKDIRREEERWFDYANSELSDTDFETDLLAFISTDSGEYNELKEASIEAFKNSLEDDDAEMSAKDIGDMGEGLAYSHECQRLKIGEREELLHLIKHIPTQLAVGYDIQSVELDGRKRYIEVKTTISRKPLQFNKIHLTPNEWNTADTLRDRYFIYRLQINKHSRKLFVIQDPVGLYKKDMLQMTMRDGADISFGSNAGIEEELLSWVN